MTDDIGLSSVNHFNFDGLGYSTIEQFENSTPTQRSSSVKNLVESLLDQNKDFSSSNDTTIDELNKTFEGINDLKESKDFDRKIQEINVREKYEDNFKTFSGIEYYTENSEYNGVVDSIDEQERTFIATFFDIRKREDMVAKFSFDDLFEDDEKQIKIGTLFVLIVGKKRRSFISNGKVINSGKENFCRIYLRRPRLLNPTEEEMINEDVERWSKLFNR